MDRIRKKVRQALTFFLAASLFTGSVPVNVLAAEVSPETLFMESSLEEGIEKNPSVNFEADSFDGIETISENHVLSGPDGMREENVIGENTVSGNVTENGEDLILQEEDDEEEEEEEPAEEIDIAFALTDDELVEHLKIIHIDKNQKETWLEDYTVTGIAGEELKFRLEIADGYKVASVKIGTAILPSVEGIYTVIPGGSDTIEIDVVQLKEYRVTFSYDTEQVKALEVKMGKKDVTLQDNVASGMFEDSKVSINVTLKKWVKIVKVIVTTSDGKKTELKATEGNMYEIESLKGNCTVKIETSLDETLCNTLDIIVMGHRKFVSVSHGGVMYGHGERLLSKNTSESISVYLDSHYVMNQVLLNNEKVDFAGTNTSYTIDFSENKNQIIVFYITPKKSNEEKKIVFANKASNITYEVNLFAPDQPDRVIVTKDEGRKNTYTVCAEETVMEFTVTAKAGYEPKITIPEEVLYHVTKTKNQYLYSVAAATLGNGNHPTEILIEEVPVIRTVSVLYDADGIRNLTAIVNGKYVTGEEDYAGEKKLEVMKFQFEHGTEIVLELEAQKGFQIGNIKEIVGEETLSEVKPEKRKYTYTIKADQDKDVELQLKEVYHGRIFDVQGAEDMEIQVQQKAYPVESGNQYKAGLYKGAESQSITQAVLKSGDKTFKENVKIVDSENVYFNVPGTEKGKTITLEMTCKNGDSLYVHTINLKVLAQVKITSVSGVKKGKVSQTADTTKEYKFTSNVVMEEGRLGVEIFTGVAEEDIITEEQREELNEKAKENFSAEIEDDVLRISVNTSIAGEKAKVRIYDIFRSTEEEKYYLAGGTVLVTSIAPAFVKTKPTVTLNRATNLSLVLDLKTKKNEQIENGVIWYKIEGTPKYKKNTTEEMKELAVPFVEYVLCTGTSQTDSVRVIGREDENIAEGEIQEKIAFDVKVSLIQTMDQNEPDESGSNIAFASKVSIKKGLSTRLPYYEPNLGIKITKAKVYTGQAGVVVARPVFGKNTSFQQITCVSKEEGISVWVNEKNHILASVEQGVEPGKYKIEVIAEASEEMVPSKKVFTIEVVQGIYDVVLDTPKELYKPYQENAVFNVNVIYNEGEKEMQPETKKLKWVLQDAEGNDIDKEHELYKIFTVKNGVVTIAQDYVVSGITAENTFRIKAIANDYEREEELVSYSDWIVITNQKITLGELVLVKEKELGSGVYDVTARSGQKAEIGKVNGSKLAVLKKGTPEREQYVESDFMEEIEEQLQFTCDNAALKIKNDNTIKAKNIAQKINITAAMKDGSNVTARIKNLQVVFTAAEELGISVKFARTGLDVAETYVGGTTKFYGAPDELLRVKIQEKMLGTGVEAFGADYTLKAEGAKIVKSNRLTGEYVLAATDSVIKLELLNNTKNYKKTFTLKNMSFANEKVEKSNAQKLTVTGSLKTGECFEEQKIVFTLPKDSRGKYHYAKVTADGLDYQNEKKTENYDALIAASGGTIGEIQKIGTNGKVTITFKPEEEGESYFIPNKNFTYKLNVSFGTVTDEFEFEGAVKHSAVTLKTKKYTIANAKLQKTVSLAVKENAMEQLVLDSKKVTLTEMGSLRNKNSKGVQNNFNQYFTIECLEVGGGTEEEEVKEIYALCLKPGVNVNKIKSSDLSGYISEYTYTDGIETKTVYNAPIKVVLKDSLHTYSLTKSLVLAGESVDTDITLKADNKKVNAGYVYVPAKQKFEASVNDDGTINLQAKDGAKLSGNNKCVLYVIPENGYYVDSIEELLSEENAKADKILKKCAIELTASVDVREKSMATGKIEFSSEKLKQTFKVKDFVPEEEGSTEGAYTLTVPYKQVVDLEVASIYNKSEESLVKVEKTSDENSVTLTLSKEDLREAYAKNKKIYGKTISVKAVVEFEEEAKKEIFTFKVTLPQQPLKIKNAITKLNQVIWEDLKIVENGLDAEELVERNQTLVEEKVKKILTADCDLQYEVSGTAVLPTMEEEGKLTYTIVLTDVVTQAQKKAVAQIILSKLLTEPAELEEQLEEAIEYWSQKVLTNATAIAEILSNIRARIEISNYKNLRLYAKEVQYVPPTMNAAGSITGIICLTDIMNTKAESLEMEFAFEIPKLMTFEEAVIAVKESVEQIVVYNEELGNKEKKESKTELIIEKAKEALKGQDYYVQLKQGSALKGELASGDIPGKATIELEVIYLTTERLFKNIVCEFQVLEKEK